MIVTQVACALQTIQNALTPTAALKTHAIQETPAIITGVFSRQRTTDAPTHTHAQTMHARLSHPEATKQPVAFTHQT
jgi:hypothetical protein